MRWHADEVRQRRPQRPQTPPRRRYVTARSRSSRLAAMSGVVAGAFCCNSSVRRVIAPCRHFTLLPAAPRSRLKRRSTEPANMRTSMLRLRDALYVRVRYARHLNDTPARAASPLPAAPPCHATRPPSCAALSPPLSPTMSPHTMGEQHAACRTGNMGVS